MGFVFSFPAKAQDDPFTINHPTRVNLDKNQIQDFGGHFSKNFTMAIVEAMQGRKKITVVHIGDSHIQADFFTGKLRSALQQFNPGMQSSRGMIFPFNLAQSNNPSNYQISSPNRWERIASTRSLIPCNYGLFGVHVFTSDSLIVLKIRQTDSTLDPFNTIQLWYGVESNSYGFIDHEGSESRLPSSDDTLVEIVLGKYEWQTQVTIRQNGKFSLYGIRLITDFPGVELNNIGINGATAASFNRSLNFGKHLQRLHPDFVVLSLGTNDVYNPSFSEEWFETNLNHLITTIQANTNQAPILVTTPNDHARKGEKVSGKVNAAHRIIAKTAKLKGLALWDFYEIMGQEGSIDQWIRDSLANPDRVHLNQKGYIFQANLLYLAIIQMFDQWIDFYRE